ncbi:EI24 domain-containing protein [Herbiconiux moechotypicola]|uniref:EI24 domain-containing protein n=1 Tax=Herbiconiux moechotypicola TaxID=637393 RepID=A0ABN3D6L1_9MICO|nr:EI24 domain-containing protein [Herbiconiux moechotypicola]MCS5728582.1 EI24 domain-containing protein [Herbiconiux moechotypicola]
MVRDFFAGVGVLLRGFSLWATRPKLMLLGMLPALIVGVVFTAALVALAVSSPTLADGVTPFADGWVEPWRTVFRAAVAAALVGVAVLLAVFTFTAITLAVGDPFYERIWRVTEESLGDAPPEPQGGFWRLLGRGVTIAARILALTAAFGAVLVVVGLIPIAGQIAAPVLSALFGGWVLALELTGFASDARGLTLRDRRRMLGTRRARTLGFGVAVYLVFLIPLGAVAAMPAAVVGATALLRRAHTEAAHTEAGRHPEG